MRWRATFSGILHQARLRHYPFHHEPTLSSRATKMVIAQSAMEVKAHHIQRVFEEPTIAMLNMP